MKTSIIYAIGIVLSLFIISSCSKSNSAGTPATAPPTVSSINPTTGPFNTVVTISGSGFSATAAQDSVWFNGVYSRVTSATPTQLTVVVPKKAGTGAVTVKTQGSSPGTGPTFSYVYTPVVTTIAGNSNTGLVDGLGTAAEFSSPMGLKADAKGNIFIADRADNAIRRIASLSGPTPGMVSTIAGTGTAGNKNGMGDTALFNQPFDLALDSADDIYVAAGANISIRLISAAGLVSAFSGGGRVPGLVDGSNPLNVRYGTLTGIVRDAAGYLYDVDNGNNVIRRTDPKGGVATLAGIPSPGYVNGAAFTAAFDYPTGIAMDANGNLYIGDGTNNAIRMVAAGTWAVTTFAGSSSGASGHVDGPANLARFSNPVAMAFDSKGNMYVADAGNHVIRMITPGGTVSTLAGTAGFASYYDAVGSQAYFNSPQGIAVDAQGNIYVSDTGNNRIREIQMQ